MDDLLVYIKKGYSGKVYMLIQICLFNNSKVFSYICKNKNIIHENIKTGKH